MRTSRDQVRPEREHKIRITAVAFNRTDIFVSMELEHVRSNSGTRTCAEKLEKVSAKYMGGIRPCVCGRGSVLFQKISQQLNEISYLEYHEFDYLVIASLEAASDVQQCLRDSHNRAS